MNLVAFSIKTKGIHNFTRRLQTVFTRFGFSEARIQKSLYAITELLRNYGTAPTFFIPAVVLRRHPVLITEIARNGAEIGIHGYTHNDYRSLNKSEQYKQTQHAITVFQTLQFPYQGFRNPYLGWTEESLHIFNALGLTYESNEAVIHDVIALNHLSPMQRSGYEKSLVLFQAISPNTYTLRPHFEGMLLRIPTSIPDDEMLFDRLRITNPYKVGQIWCEVMQSVYSYGGLYTLNLHPERGILCKEALNTLLHYARSRPGAVWLTRIDDVARWWTERSQFRLSITPLTPDYWLVDANCTPRATLLGRNIIMDSQSPIATSDSNEQIFSHHVVIHATKYPCISLSYQTPASVMEFLYEQGYPTVRCSQQDAQKYSIYLDIPEGLGTTRAELQQKCGALMQQIEQSDTPLIYFGCWPDNCRAALAISGDIDSVTIQDFFIRIFEVYHMK